MYVSTFFAIFDTHLPHVSTFLYLSLITFRLLPPPPEKCCRTLWTAPIVQWVVDSEHFFAAALPATLKPRLYQD